MRAWLALKFMELPFRQHKVLMGDHFLPLLAPHSPAGRVPILIDQDLKVWDSLAICEYANDVLAPGRGWPGDPSQRARARTICAEIHSGFLALRTQLPFNVRRSKPTDCLTAEAELEIRRLQDIVQEAEGPGLFGEISIADAFVVPSLLRLRSYCIPLDGKVRSYLQAMEGTAALKEWMAQVAQETEVVEKYEAP